MARFRGAIVWCLLAALALQACAAPTPRAVTQYSEKPKRIVSLDYCADQYVLKLADKADIVALSPDATRDFSYMASSAKGMPQVRPVGEDILSMRPDLIVRSYGGAPSAVAFFERAGIKVHQIGWGEDFDAVRTNILEAANSLGQSKRGQDLVREFDQRLANIQPAKGVTTLYVTAGGVTTGGGSMIDLMMRTAGLVNFQTREGWGPLPLERLASEKPDMLAAAFFNDKAISREHWSSARHPLISRTLADRPVAALNSATTSCGGWFIMDAIELLAEKGRETKARAP